MRARGSQMGIRSPCGIGSDEIEIDSECLSLEAFRRPSQQKPVPGAWFALICVGHESIRSLKPELNCRGLGCKLFGYFERSKKTLTKQIGLVNLV
jgi:hypothetical protein